MQDVWCVYYIGDLMVARIGRYLILTHIRTNNSNGLLGDDQ